MHRIALDYLDEWRTRPRRKPLVIRGARQVGKSCLVSLFAEKRFSRFIELNFEKDPGDRSLFTGSARKAIQLLELKYGRAIDLADTLLFLDEIQAAPEVFSKLRYFYEDLPQLPVIAAGSLLDFVLQEPTFSMPVGRIEYLHLGPMSFEEFLLASGETSLVAFLQGYSLSEEMPDFVHDTLASLLKTFLIVGGMPESVLSFCQTESFHESERVKASILGTYGDDFNKYAARIGREKILPVFNKIPLLVGQKFKYVNVDRNERAAAIERVLQLLAMARILYRVQHSGCNGLPLGAEVNPRKFKPLFLDVGLMASACGLGLIDIDNADDLMMVNSGGICEQFAGQHLLYAGEMFQQPELYYWVREAKSSSAEVDYITSVGTDIVPVEIKAGKTGRLKSLHQFIKEKRIAMAVRINLDKPTVHQDAHKLPTGETVAYTLLSLPFYLIGQLKRLVREYRNREP
jgi:predicted AAA+ superfamily ATPase